MPSTPGIRQARREAAQVPEPAATARRPCGRDVHQSDPSAETDSLSAGHIKTATKGRLTDRNRQRAQHGREGQHHVGAPLPCPTPRTVATARNTATTRTATTSRSRVPRPVSYTHLTLPTIYSV